MKAFLLTIALGASFVMTAMAQTPVTATCKDGSSFSGASRGGACRGHGGVQTWGTGTEPPTSTTPVMPVQATPATRTPPAATAASKPAASTPAPGGAPGQVWVNTGSHVYHCPGTQYYGNTKKGEYMTEVAAKAAGNHADHGKACS
jgi:hypothetical protein